MKMKMLKIKLTFEKRSREMVFIFFFFFLLELCSRKSYDGLKKKEKKKKYVPVSTPLSHKYIFLRGIML